MQRGVTQWSFLSSLLLMGSLQRLRIERQRSRPLPFSPPPPSSPPLPRFLYAFRSWKASSLTWERFGDKPCRARA